MFKDRIDAANQLAEKISKDLSEQLKGDFNSEDIVVLAIPRGGVVVGDIVASRAWSKA
jgi:putative phosphoribosyl transferase